MSDKTFKIVNGDISDGYHTFDELYRHRVNLFLALCATMPNKVQCREEPSYGDWICVYLELPTGQISYHVPGEYRPVLVDLYPWTVVNPWDGHDSDKVAVRLLAFASHGLTKGEVPHE